MAQRRRTLQQRRQARNKSIAAIRKRNESYAAALADPKSRFKSTTTAATDKSSIKGYLQRPSDNFANIAATLRQAYISNGVIGRVIDYYQAHPTYNYSIYPVLGNKQYELDTNNMHDDFIDIAYGINQLNIPFYAPYFFRETLIQGVSFFYKIQDTTGVGYMQFPVEWCRITNMENGVYRYRLDISKLKAEVRDSLPKELQQAYDTYHNGSTDDETKWYDRKWYYVSDDGMAFTFDQGSLINGGTAISPFAGALADALSLAQAKENIDIKDKLDTVRIIHSKIPTDANGEPTISLKVAKIMDEQMRNRMPEGVVPVTSASTITNVPLKGSGNEGVYESVKSGLGQLFYDLGVSAPLFGSDTTSSNIVKLSIKKDANWVYTNLFPMLENYYDYELTQIKTKSKITWNIKFIRESNFTLKDDIANYKDQLSYGGSRMDYLAACGFSPIQVVSQLAFEQQVLDIDSLMVVKPTSNTLSSKDASSQHNKPNVVKGPTISNDPNKGKVGRPETDNPTDDTDRLDDAQ